MKGCCVPLGKIFTAAVAADWLKLIVGNNEGELYEYSGFGKLVKVAAPGLDIFSTMPNNEYTYWSGTSVATAFVTGVAVLIKSYKPNLLAKDIANILVGGKTSLNTLKQKILSEGIINASLCLEIADTYCKD